MTNEINNKMKKFAGGNWGHPRKDGKKAANAFYRGVPVEDIADLAEDIINEEKVEAPKKRTPRRKKRNKRPYQSPWEPCPFCGETLPIDQKKLDADKAKGPLWLWGHDRVKECPSCGCYQVEECPSCKRKTWYNPKTLIYKHQWMGCGFMGQKKKLK